MEVADKNDDKLWNHEVSVKVADTNHESRGWDVCDKVRDKSATNLFVSL